MTSQRPYHHRHLRRTLLDAALAAVGDSGPGELSMRDLARRAGVSHAAPAHHFGDKAGLLTALATEGWARLAEWLREAEPRGFLEVGVAYVEFAIEKRAYFEVMFRPELYHAHDEELAAARAEAGNVLYALALAQWAARPSTEQQLEPGQQQRPGEQQGAGQQEAPGRLVDLGQQQGAEQQAEPGQQQVPGQEQGAGQQEAPGRPAELGQQQTAEQQPEPGQQHGPRRQPLVGQQAGLAPGRPVELGHQAGPAPGRPVELGHQAGPAPIELSQRAGQGDQSVTGRQGQLGQPRTLGLDAEPEQKLGPGGLQGRLGQSRSEVTPGSAEVGGAQGAEGVDFLADPLASREALSLAVAAWGLVHGVATLFLNGNLPPALGDDPLEITRRVAAQLLRS